MAATNRKRYPQACLALTSMAIASFLVFQFVVSFGEPAASRIRFGMSEAEVSALIPDTDRFKPTAALRYTRRTAWEPDDTYGYTKSWECKDGIIIVRFSSEGLAREVTSCEAVGRRSKSIVERVFAWFGIK